VNRRAFTTLLGGTAAAWPLAARAQQATLPTIGFLGESTPLAQSERTAAFVQRLRELGWIEGRTVAIEYRWAEGRTERFAEIANEFVRLKVDVIVTSSTPAVIAAKQATSIIPIVFAIAADPIGTGRVASLARPGGDVTGLSIQSTDIAAKRLALLREVVPGLRRLAIVANFGNPASALESGEVQTAARALGLEVTTVEIRRAEDITPCLRGDRGACRCSLCSHRAACIDQPGSYQHHGARRAPCDDLQRSGVRRIGRSNVLRTKPTGSIPACRRHCRQDFARGEGRRYPGRTADKI
jgi:putative tryptophan/tyrosine transport system substrate-binding protein